MSGTFVFEPESIQKYYTRRVQIFSRDIDGNMIPQLVADNLEAAVANIHEVMTNIDSSFDWTAMKTYRESVQKFTWTVREYLFAQMMICSYLIIEGRQTRRAIPSDYKADDYQCYMFGSSNLTSDIDVTVEGPEASFLISVIEDAWLQITGRPCSTWDIEYYGDFLMFLDESGESVFLNSREFKTNVADILPFVGASILRNTGTLEFQQLNDFISMFPVLQGGDWKARAYELYRAIQGLDYEAQREQYYRYLSEAEKIRNLPIASTKEGNLQMFLALSMANLFRSENYILPSTVIHIVRDIQAGSPKPNNPNRTCQLYHVKLATCALGSFTYLCSAMEQLGYMKRFEDDPAKLKKYKKRLDAALDQYAALKGQQGGRKRNRGPKRKTRKITRKRRRT